MSVDCSNRSDVTTSDEEEKLRTKKAKKPRVKAASPTPPATLPSTLSPSPSSTKTKQLRRANKQITKPTSSSSTKDSSRRSSRPKANLQRVPYIFGPELPPASPAPRQEGSPYPLRSPPSSKSKHSASALGSPRQCQAKTPTSSCGIAECRKANRGSIRPTLKHVGRKISFGQLAPPQEDENMALGDAQALGSAFQLQ